MNTELAIIKLQEDVTFLNKQLIEMCQLIETLKQAEHHTHYTFITDNRPCAECLEEDTDDNTDLNEYI